MKSLLITGLLLVSSAQAGVECRHATKDHTAYISVSGAGEYERVYYKSHAERDTALKACKRMARDCRVTTVRESNWDADGLGVHHNTYSNVERYTNDYTHRLYSSYDSCISRIVDEVVDALESARSSDPHACERSGPNWGRNADGTLNPTSPCNKL